MIFVFKLSCSRVNFLSIILAFFITFEEFLLGQHGGCSEIIRTFLFFHFIHLQENIWVCYKFFRALILYELQDEGLRGERLVHNLNNTEERLGSNHDCYSHSTTSIIRCSGQICYSHNFRSDLTIMLLFTYLSHIALAVRQSEYYSL